MSGTDKPKPIQCPQRTLNDEIANQNKRKAGLDNGHYISETCRDTSPMPRIADSGIHIFICIVILVFTGRACGTPGYDIDVTPSRRVGLYPGAPAAHPTIRWSVFRRWRRGATA